MKKWKWILRDMIETILSATIAVGITMLLFKLFY